MSKRIQVIMSDKLNDKLESISESYGASKSSICTFIIGQYIENMEKANAVMFGKDDTTGALFELFKNIEKGVKQGD